MKIERYISPEYLQSQKWLHGRPKGYGGGGDKWASVVADLINEHDCTSMLDYGCGQGKLVEALRKMVSIEFVEYDPAIDGKDRLTEKRQYDLVVCTDVLEHIEKDKLMVVIDHLFKLTSKVLFIVVATRPSNKFFPDGRNVHLTIEPASWWNERLNHPSFMTFIPPISPLDQPTREYVCLFGRKS